eukprot:Blabericola_migrator_1__13421@NODE_960_length_5893_cov_55_259183_g666_i0_p5_GENE_NODE_960_length_5893_cov_55_259183_g666_i0NODE_960_length_5893_cov_55_259183_g666_i0_p5_ORF_typecomplete_len126_score16_50DUF3343/PF11823_8/6_6e03DUF3343/PF11823_8/0_38_NODE_960_length_5893_cov_55_259183_g666_i014821859
MYSLGTSSCCFLYWKCRLMAQHLDSCGTSSPRMKKTGGVLEMYVSSTSDARASTCLSVRMLSAKRPSSGCGLCWRAATSAMSSVAGNLVVCVTGQTFLGASVLTIFGKSSRSGFLQTGLAGSTTS